MKDVIVHIRNNQKKLAINRKTAKRLYLQGTSPKLTRNQAEEKELERIRVILKNEFDEKLWPVEL